MGKREFYAWVDQAYREIERESKGASTDSWEGADQDPWWQQARARRDKELGRG